MSDRYRAVVTLCEARKAAGILTDRQAALCRELIKAWEDRRTARVKELLDEADRELAREGEIVRAEASVTETRPTAPGVLPSDSFLAVSIDAVDELALYNRFTSGDTIRIVSCVVPLDAAADPKELVPPKLWDRYEAAAARVWRVAGTAGRRIAVGPGIPLARSDARAWILAAMRFQPPSPIHLIADSSPANLADLAGVDTVVCQASEHSIAAAVVLLAEIPARHPLLFSRDDDSRVAIVGQALSELAAPVAAMAFTAPEIRGFTDGRRFILANASAATRRIRVEIPAAATARSALLTTLADDGSLSEDELPTRTKALVVDLPPSSVTFAALASSPRGR